MKQFWLVFFCAGLMAVRLHAEPAPVIPPKPADRLTALSATESDKANKEIKGWMKAEPESPWPWVAAAEVRLRDKNFKKCLKLAEAALDRAPHTAEAYYLRGRCFEERDNALDAANEYRAALELEADHAAASEGLSRVQVRLGSAESAPRPN